MSRKKGTGPWTLKVWRGLVKSNSWTRDCTSFYGQVLTGEWVHWCNEWDGLPIDETCSEFKHCKCFPDYPKPAFTAKPTEPEISWSDIFPDSLEPTKEAEK